MITGYVNSNLEIVVRLVARATDGRSIELDAVLDTGFNGDLTLPLSVIQSLGLPFESVGLAILSTGEQEMFDVYKGTVDWDGEERMIDVDASTDQFLIGMGLLYGYELRIPVLDGATVVIQKLPYP
jgi:clan AA aspartic protease